MADDGRARIAWPSVLFGEVAADGRRDPEQPEVRPRHLAARQPLRDRAVAEGHRAPPVSGDLLELGLLRVEREVVRNREGKSVGRGVRIDADQPVGILVRQGLEEGGVDGGEDRGRRADAETDGDDDGQRETRDPQQVAEADPEVLREILKEQQSLHAILLVQILSPAVLPRAFEVAELPHRLAARRLGRQPCRPQLVDPHLEVDAKLLVHLVPDDLRPAAPGTRTSRLTIC